MVLYDKRTLVVRHLPHQLTTADKIDLLQFFGAEDVKCESSNLKNNNLVYARFRTSHEADIALKKLHQTEIFDQIISVEYARGSNLERVLIYEAIRTNDTKEDQTTQKKYLENFLQKLNSWTDKLDFNQPPPIHLSYRYPPPTSQVIINISNALASFPKLYTQVLHLMNKMNLPCPFSESFSLETNIVVEQLQNVLNNSRAGNKRKNSSEEESEIETDEDIRKEEDTLTSKCKVNKVHKAIKKPKLIKPVPANVIKAKSFLKPEDVFETGHIDLQKKIELKVSTDLKHLEDEKEEISAEGFEKVLPVPQREDIPELKDVDKEEKIITTAELAANRISSKDLHMLPVFKNYQAGVPSCRLYIKNLAKTVTISELKSIYKRYLLTIQEEQGSMFDVQLLQEGRMKGQAFISLQNTEQAKLAVSETNGYILKGKPMVVQFARAKPK